MVLDMAHWALVLRWPRALFVVPDGMGGSVPCWSQPVLRLNRTSLPLSFGAATDQYKNRGAKEEKHMD
jgi:hypothetical protein